MVTKKTERRAGIGKKSSRLLSALVENNKSIFTVDDAVKILNEKKSSVTKLLHDLTINKWLFRLSRGKYLILPLEAGVKPEFTEHEFIIASNLITPSYISYWSALNYYGFTEQVSKTIFVATTKRKREMNLLGLKIKFVTIKKDKFLGFNKLEDYAKKMKNQAIINRLGYILELLGIETKLKSGKHYIFLDPLLKKKISYNAKWKIIENIPKTDLLSWREH